DLVRDAVEGGPRVGPSERRGDQEVLRRRARSQPPAVLHPLRVREGPHRDDGRDLPDGDGRLDAGRGTPGDGLVRLPHLLQGLRPVHPRLQAARVREEMSLPFPEIPAFRLNGLVLLLCAMALASPLVEPVPGDRAYWFWTARAAGVALAAAAVFWPRVQKTALLGVTIFLVLVPCMLQMRYRYWTGPQTWC